MTARSQDGLFVVGVATGVHGLRGDLRIRTVSPDSDSLAAVDAVTLRRPDGRSEQCRLVRAVPHKGGWLLRLQGRESIEAAQELVGCEVLMPLAELPGLEEDEFYWHQLEGVAVVDRSRGPLGRVTGLIDSAAHDIYVVEGPFGEVLIPAVSAFIGKIDPEAGRMEVDLPEGLVPGDEKTDP